MIEEKVKNENESFLSKRDCLILSLFISGYLITSLIGKYFANSEKEKDQIAIDYSIPREIPLGNFYHFSDFLIR